MWPLNPGSFTGYGMKQESKTSEITTTTNSYFITSLPISSSHYASAVYCELSTAILRYHWKNKKMTKQEWAKNAQQVLYFGFQDINNIKIIFSKEILETILDKYQHLYLFKYLSN